MYLGLTLKKLGIQAGKENRAYLLGLELLTCLFRYRPKPVFRLIEIMKDNGSMDATNPYFKAYFGLFKNPNELPTQFADVRNFYRLIIISNIR
jgi:hypothetical protein